MNQIWLHQDRAVTVDMKSPKMPGCLPDGKHSLYVQIALNRLSWLPLKLPATVTIDNLPWPIKSIVVPNEGQTPTWRMHRQHQHPDLREADCLTPFIYADRSKQLPMTRSLTFELESTDSGDFVITDVYPGMKIPLLPWQLSDPGELDVCNESIEFWRTHSFLYDSRLTSGKHDYPAPAWSTLLHAISA